MSHAPGLDVSGRYVVGGRCLFKQLTLTLRPGKWLCLLGPSGVGKTTILRLVLGLPIDGVFHGDITASDGGEIATRTAYMAQSDLLLPWLTVQENVGLGARLRGETPENDRVQHMLQRVGLAQHSNKLPRALSGGMRQRTALARTLMEDRPIVLLDEPFSALDAGTRADMQELASEVLCGKTVLLVTHDPAEAARMAHDIIVMSPHGAHSWAVPTTDAIRKIDDPAVLACQSALLTHLRAVKT